MVLNGRAITLHATKALGRSLACRFGARLLTPTELAERLWAVEFLSLGRPPRPLPPESIFAAAINLVAADRVELVAALADT
jgi:hypothetical protein